MRLLRMLGLFALAGVAFADEGRGVEFSGSGFLTLAAGKILGGNHEPATDVGFHCPCFISDYAQAGVYERGGWRFGPDSRLGLQGSVSADNGRYALTGQVVARGADGGSAGLEWLYGTIELSGKFTLQAGRKRLPLFYYSESQDVGFSFPWAHLPPQLYGWEIVNYNGVSLGYRDQWGQWTAAGTLFGGSETRKDNGYWKIYNGKDSRTDSRWSDIAGGELKLGREWFEGRVLYIQSYTQNKAVSAGATDFSPRRRQRIYGLGFRADYGNWIAHSEFLYIDRKADYGQDYSQLAGVGYRLGRFLPFVSYNNYRQRTRPELAQPAEGHATWSVVLRYDLTNSSDVKLQLDHWQDKTKPGFGSFHGDAHLITVSYDMVF